jgi:hypothetical protein
MSITPSSSTVPFQAQWNASNCHLQEGFFDRTKRIVFFALNWIASSIIVPSATSFVFSGNVKKEIEKEFEHRWNRPMEARRPSWSFSTRDHYALENIEVTTPDGALIRGTHYKNVRAPADAPTMILAQPNACIRKQDVYTWLMVKTALYGYPCHFVTFDYRGAGDSGNWKPGSFNQLTLDGEGIYQYVREKLGVAADKIIFYGWSLGGAVVATVKGMHPEAIGNFVNERSFAAIEKFLPDSIVGRIGKFFLSFLKWNGDPESAVRKMTGKTLVVHHPDDDIVTSETGMYQALFHSSVPTPANVSQIDLSSGRDFKGYLGLHCLDLRTFNNAIFKAEEQIIEFLFNAPQSCIQKQLAEFASYPEELRQRTFEVVSKHLQEDSHYWNSGEDAFYGRNGLSLTDDQKFNAIVNARMQDDLDFFTPMV